MKTQRNKRIPQQPELPMYAEVMYFGCFIGSFIFIDSPVMHGICSCLPIFMLVKIVHDRLVRGELGSNIVCLSILAESVAHLFHQFAHDERLRVIQNVEHLICCLFLAIGNMIYVLEGKQKRKYKLKSSSTKLISSQSMTTFPILIGGLYLLVLKYQSEESNSIIYNIAIFYTIPLITQLIFAIHRRKTSSKRSLILGIAAALTYGMADIVELKYPLAHKILHRLSIYLQAKQVLSHVKWFSKNKHKLL